MFNFFAGKKEHSTCYMTYGTMGHVDPKQPPTKRKPFAPLLAIPFVHKAEFILPKELYNIVKSEIDRLSIPVHSRVIAPLLALVEGDFFNEYIKKGNILMLSEGTHGIDNVFYMKDGILILTLDKENYERAGLVGKPDGAKGKRGTRPRWIVEINLRLPSMLHGKRGFDRIVYAFKNVLNSPVTWLFCDLEGKALSPDPLQKYFPAVIKSPPTTLQGPVVQIPWLQPLEKQTDEAGEYFNDFAVDIYEWLSLISLNSPRVDVNDRIDPFLSRYSPPSPDVPETRMESLVKVSWEGFFPGSWAYQALVQVLLAAPSKFWFSYSVSGFNDSISEGSRDCTILKTSGPSRKFLLWEVEQN